MELDPVENAPTRCPNCGNRSIRFDARRNEFVCERCGFVLGGRLVAGAPEGSPSQLRDSSARPVSPVLRADKGLGSVMGEARSAASEAKDRIARMRQLDRRSRLDVRQRSIEGALSAMDRVASRLSLPIEFRERAAAILRKGLDAKLSRGRSIDALSAAAVYLAARDRGAPRSLREVARAADMTVSRLGASAKLLSRRTKTVTPPPRAEDFVSRLASELGVPLRVANRALAILSNRDEKAAEPVGLAAGALYLAAKIEGVKLIQEEIAAASGTTEASLRRYYRVLRDGME